ncbi:polyprenyl synthetase family protein [Streptomyces sp. NBC_00191]|uniref:polyprenyl synthetase family protein n=1 Tax=Streptomyces sp. NBC_00191 TaxID=2975674 RepID=UPI00324E30AA
MVSPADPGRTAEEILVASRAVLDPALRAAVGRLPEPLRGFAEFHYGWAGSGGGAPEGLLSRLRMPTLVLLSADVNGDGWDGAVEAAAAWSLMGNHTLIHDDIMDRDSHRRGRPTLWTAFGTAAALQTGNALLALAFELLSEQSGRKIPAAIGRMGRTVQVMGAGQVADMDLEARTEVALEESMAVVEAKACRVMSFACELGGLCAGSADDQIEALSAFGHHLGVACQLQDDLEDLWPTVNWVDGVHGSDIRRRKKTPMLLAALRAQGADRDRLAGLYCSDTPLSDTQIRQAAELVKSCGGSGWALQTIEEHMDLAAQSLNRARPTPRAHRELKAFASVFGCTATGDDRSLTGSVPDSDLHGRPCRGDTTPGTQQAPQGAPPRDT